jgi:hypothetical protein
LDYSVLTGFAKIASTINGKGRDKSRKWAGETARSHLELTPWYECNRRPLRFHASTDCLQTEGPLHAPWALYKEDTVIPAQKGEDFIELFNAAAEISA